MALSLWRFCVFLLRGMLARTCGVHKNSWIICVSVTSGLEQVAVTRRWSWDPPAAWPYIGAHCSTRGASSILSCKHRLVVFFVVWKCNCRSCMWICSTAPALALSDVLSLAQFLLKRCFIAATKAAWVQVLGTKLPDHPYERTSIRVSKKSSFCYSEIC